jgi:anti-sigma regulatory factor (Ser/Thr protein kinase)
MWSIVTDRRHNRHANGLFMAADRPVRSLPLAVFGPEMASVTQSRHRLIDFLYDVPDEVRYVAALLVSELTTNVIRHAHTPFSLSADRTPSGVRVEVADGTSEHAVARRPPPTSLDGRGLWLVSELADSWGSESTGNGKMVWFELSLIKPEVLEEVGDLEDSANDR